MISFFEFLTEIHCLLYLVNCFVNLVGFSSIHLFSIASIVIKSIFFKISISKSCLSTFIKLNWVVDVKTVSQTIFVFGESRLIIRIIFFK